MITFLENVRWEWNNDTLSQVAFNLSPQSIFKTQVPTLFLVMAELILIQQTIPVYLPQPALLRADGIEM